MPDQQPLVDAVDLLDHLEADLGSVSLGPVLRDCPDCGVAGPGRERGNLAAPLGSAGTAPTLRDRATVHAAGTCLLRFLDALPEPVVEYRLYEAAIRCESRDAAYEVLHRLSEVVRPSSCAPFRLPAGFWRGLKPGVCETVKLSWEQC